ncbi:barstar family protein [Arenimonas oryziterrae]|uniref:Barstar (barnase inhibitor) domain-containing protein n=1 Tax=Arenimonas oryziterrae DSM 21050 = YC6267 TaxID=1121015 RepID=A0A091AWV3_9GAMM|nr:barstar family protein [Arenimonas oryziterrae]KFN43896.1 hypothetical protein N789_08080 [Arenimonas oryziterrae DSM 21050 = YC6267]
MSVLWFDGLLTQVHDAGVYFLPDDDIDELHEAAAVNRFPCLRVDLAGVRDKPGLLTKLSSVLELPQYFGNNWDALADVLGDLRMADTKGLVLLIEHSDDLREHARADFKAAMEVLQAASQEWAQRGAPFWAFIALSEPEFDALDAGP